MTTTQGQQQQQATKRPPLKWRIDLPAGENAFKHPSLEAVCGGLARIVPLLAYFIYEGSKEADRQKLESGCQVVAFSRKHADILKVVKISEKTLIGYLRKLATWGYVSQQPYHMEYTVSFEKINAAIKEPPAPDEKRRGRPRKGCSNYRKENATTLQPEEVEALLQVVTLQEKVVTLQLQVEELQRQAVILQPLAEILQRYNLDSEQIASALMSLLEERRLLDDKRLLETKRVCVSPPENKEPESEHTHITSSLPIGDFEQDGITSLEDEDETPTEARLPAVQAAPKPDTPSQGADGRESPPAVVGQSVAPVPPGKAAKRPAKAAKPVDIPLEATLSEDEQALYHEWCSLFRVAVPLSPSVAKAAKALSSPLAVWAEALKVERREVLKQMRAWEYACNNGNGFFSRKGVKLCDLERDFEAWQSSMQQQMEEQIARQTKTEKVIVFGGSKSGRRISSFDDPMYDVEQEFYPAHVEPVAAQR